MSTKISNKRKLPLEESVKPEKKQRLTDFQLLVYCGALAIPAGSVLSYAGLASFIGAPKAARAVGSALRRNPFAPQVPCHRIIRNDLSIGGFYGSQDPESDEIHRKIRLLKQEKVIFQADGKSISSKSLGDSKSWKFTRMDEIQLKRLVEKKKTEETGKEEEETTKA